MSAEGTGYDGVSLHGAQALLVSGSFMARPRIKQNYRS